MVLYMGDFPEDYDGRIKITEYFAEKHRQRAEAENVEEDDDVGHWWITGHTADYEEGEGSYVVRSDYDEIGNLIDEEGEETEEDQKLQTLLKLPTGCYSFVDGVWIACDPLS